MCCLVRVAGQVRLLLRILTKARKCHILLLSLLMMIVVVMIAVTNPITVRCPSQNWNPTLIVGTAAHQWSMWSVSFEVF